LQRQRDRHQNKEAAPIEAASLREHDPENAQRFSEEIMLNQNRERHASVPAREEPRLELELR